MPIETYPPLDSFVTTLIRPYRPIRFDMDATAIMNNNQAAADIDESSKSATTFMSLARELRDHIYEDLVGTKYRFDTYQILNGVPHFSEPPKLSEPRSDSEKISPDDPTRAMTCGESRVGSKEVRYEHRFPPPASLSILRTSSKVRDEALQVVYRKGTLLFVLNHPSQDPFSTTQSDVLIKHFNNVEICLDMVSIFSHSISATDAIRSRNITVSLVRRLADCTSEGGTCTFTTYHFRDPRWKIIYPIIHDAGVLCVFKKVVLRFGHSLRITEDGFTGSSTELVAVRDDTPEGARSLYEKIALDKDIHCLGPCEKSYDSEGFFCMVFYPENQLGGGGCPNGRREVIAWSSE